MNFSEMVKAAGYDPAKATGECSYDTLCELMESMARSGELVEVSERKFLKTRQEGLECLKRAIERREYDRETH